MGILSWIARGHTTMNPQNPQTGNGRTTRDIYDKPRVTFRDADGRKIKKPKKK